MRASRRVDLKKLARAVPGERGVHAGERDPWADAEPASRDRHMARDIERFKRESNAALAVVQEVYGSAMPDMLVVPRRFG